MAQSKSNFLCSNTHISRICAKKNLSDSYAKTHSRMLVIFFFSNFLSLSSQASINFFSLSLLFFFRCNFLSLFVESQKIILKSFRDLIIICYIVSFLYFVLTCHSFYAWRLDENSNSPNSQIVAGR